MTRGATRDYKADGRKNNWRRQGHNEVLRRTAGREQRWPILYLAGPQDEDRRIAIEKGVPSTNMIAVDQFLPNVRRVRRDGGVAIPARIEWVLQAWPDDRPVAAVILDFCNGFDRQLMRLVINALGRQPFLETVVWINFLRGRDASTNDVRVALQHPDFGVSTKHRGVQFVWWLALIAAASCPVTLENGEIGLSTLHMIDAHRRLTEIFRPRFNTYRSDLQTFDSIIFDNRLVPGAVWRPPRVNVPPIEVRQRVRAALAVRTMREDRW